MQTQRTSVICDDSYAFTLTVTTDSYRLDRGEKMLLQFLFLRGKGCLPKKKSPYGGTLSQPHITPSPPSKVGTKIEGTFFGF